MQPWRLPWLTFAVVAAALWISFGPDSTQLSTALRLERSAVLRGEIWRSATGHLVHGWPALAAADLGALALLGTWVELRSRRELALALGLGAVLAGAAVLALRSDLERYEGASALASAAFASAAVPLLRARRSSARRLAWLALLGFGAKLGLESAGLSPGPSAIGAPAGVESVAVAHLAGGLGGVIASLLPRRPR